MMEPRRLLDDPESPQAGALLRAALDEPTPPGAPARALAALGVGAGLAITPGAAAAAKGASAVKSISGVSVGVIKWLGGGIVAGAVVAASVAPSQPKSSPGSRVQAPIAAPRVVAEPRENARSTVDEAKQPQSLSVEPDREPSPAATSARRTSASASSAARGTVAPSAARSTPQTDALDREIALLDAARGALARGDALAALAALDRYESEHPAGRLRPEAFVLRLEALVRAGRTAEARALAQSWLAQKPNSAHAARIRKIVGQ